MPDGKIIGYLAYITKAEPICEGNSCIIAGSRDKMKTYLKQNNPRLIDRVTISKARFGDIKRALQLGAAYSFDEEAYNRFHPLARKAGIKVGPEDFTGETPTGLHFVRIQKISLSKN